MFETKHRKESTGKPESKPPLNIGGISRMGGGNWDFKFFSQGKKFNPGFLPEEEKRVHIRLQRQLRRHWNNF